MPFNKIPKNNLLPKSNILRENKNRKGKSDMKDSDKMVNPYNIPMNL
jgi:hypothetical protein